MIEVERALLGCFVWLLVACSVEAPEVSPDAGLSNIEKPELEEYENLDRIVYPETCSRYYRLPYCHVMPCPKPGDVRSCDITTDVEGDLYTCSCEASP